MLLRLDSEQIKLKKIFTEIRYNDVFTLPENKYKILDKLSNQFPAYDKDQMDRLILFNPDKSMTVQVLLNRVIVDWEEPVNYTEFNKLTKSIIDTIIQILNVKTANRIGTRSVWNYNVDSQESAKTYIYNKFLSSKAKSLTDFTDEILPPAIRLAGRKENLLFSLNVLHQQQHTLEGSLNKMTLSNVQDVITFDIDTYRENSINLKNIGTFSETSEKLTKHLFSYLKNVEE